MANVYNTDAHCIAVYRFEAGALTTDSKGGNTLTPSGSAPTEDAVNFREGLCSALFTRANSQYYHCHEADQDAGFPLRSDDADKKISVFVRIRPATIAGANYYDICGKFLFSASQYDFLMTINNSRLQVWVGQTISGYITYTPAYDLIVDQWYDIGVVSDGENNILHIEIYDVTDDSWHEYDYTPAEEGTTNGLDWTVGAQSDPSNYFDGRIDELVVFNDLLEYDGHNEIVELSEGTYDAAEAHVNWASVGISSSMPSFNKGNSSGMIIF